MRTLTFSALLLCSLALLFGCASPNKPPETTGPGTIPTAEAPAQEPWETPPPANGVYRGQVGLVTAQTLEVGQLLPGYDYGYGRIRFHINEDTTFIDCSVLQEGSYVEVWYSGVLTRSDPPMATAVEVRLIANFAEDAIINGYIATAAAVEGGYRLMVRPFTSEELRGNWPEEEGWELDDSKLIILNVPTSALEGLTEVGLVEGAKISAVTSGVSTLSHPAQYPVRTLLPFSEPVQN